MRSIIRLVGLTGVIALEAGAADAEKDFYVADWRNLGENSPRSGLVSPEDRSVRRFGASLNVTFPTNGGHAP